MAVTILKSHPKLTTKETLVNIFENVISSAQFNEIKLYNHLITLSLRRTRFCRNHTFIESSNSKSIFLVHNQETQALYKQKDRLKKHTKHEVSLRVLDTYLVMCILIYLVTTIAGIVIKSNALIFLAIGAILVLFLRCLYVEIATKRYSVISNFINQAPKVSVQSEFEEILISEKYLQLKSTQNEPLQEQYLRTIEKENDIHRNTLLSLLKELHDNGFVDLDNKTQRVINEHLFTLRHDFSFSIAESTRFLIILNKSKALKFKSSQKAVANFIISKFSVKGIPINGNSYYKILNRSSAYPLTELCSKTSYTVIQLLKIFDVADGK